MNGKPLTRAYSIASSLYEDGLEFFSIKVPNGPLTSKLQHLRVGDQIILSKKPVGTLLYDNLKPGKTSGYFRPAPASRHSCQSFATRKPMNVSIRSFSFMACVR